MQLALSSDRRSDFSGTLTSESLHRTPFAAEWFKSHEYTYIHPLLIDKTVCDGGGHAPMRCLRHSHSRQYLEAIKGKAKVGTEMCLCFDIRNNERVTGIHLRRLSIMAMSKILST